MIILRGLKRLGTGEPSVAKYLHNLRSIGVLGKSQDESTVQNNEHSHQKAMDFHQGFVSC